MSVCVSDKKKNYSKVTKLLVKPLFIYNHYSIEPRKVVGFVDEYFDALKNNVYTYLLIINLISNTSEWQLPDYIIYQFNHLFNRIEGL